MPTKNKAYFPILVLILALATDLLSPFMIAKGWAPAALRWISHGVIALLIFWVVLRMLAFKRIPGVVILIAFISAIGISCALLHGQGITVTAWGWWLLFQFPIVGLFTYLQTDWPENLPHLLMLSCVGILAFEVLVQIFQYLRGALPGDHLAGTFGRFGTGNLVLFVILVICLTIGDWLATRRWNLVLLASILGVISSTLGEMKIFLPIMLLLGIMALFLFLLKGHSRLILIPYTIAVLLILASFLSAYNAFVPAAKQVPLEKFLTDPRSIMQYMNASTRQATQQSYFYDIGRNFALEYGWSQIRGDPITMLFGIGLGARSESSALGLAGQGLTQGSLGISTGTSLLVMMQEIGLVGLLILSGFFIYIIYRLNQAIVKNPGSNRNGLRFGLLLFTILWPILLWYNTAWMLRVAMLLYWAILGYVLHPTPTQEPVRESPPSSLSYLYAG